MTEPHSKPGLSARRAAAKLLAAVIDKRTPLDGLLDPVGGNPAFRDLEAADQALVRAMLLSALRHLPVIEAVLSRLVDRPLPGGARALTHLLTIAATQILYLDVPDHAAVDLAVEQANTDPRNRRYAALVNAVLRRLGREKDRLLPEIAAETVNAPPWFHERLERAYGPLSEEILAAHLAAPPVDLTVKNDPQAWADRLGGIVLPTGTVRLRPFDGPVTQLPGFAEGEWWVQDAAASIPARLFGDIKDARIADLCAAPGGKTAQLIAAGARVTAVDLSRNRLKRLSENLHRLQLDAEIVQGDILKWQPEAAFDAILLDAPCSSTGTVRRHPDIPWTKSPADIEKLAALQERMLRHALTLVRPGGSVVFSNCSLDPAEGEDMVEGVLKTLPEIARKPVRPVDLPGLEEAITPRGEVRTHPAMLKGETPQLSGMDGFFAAVLVR
ncbi:RsmB/NOP family class I SAM-dependent RNA methyltransferase [Hoeflea sp.]|uniref:RsmB/NOP family class I SAM-dependent RNA methyltransferase n=1 Tax=Hoeflea sp. TaxID=1940281 RepID=UPI003B015AA3